MEKTVICFFLAFAGTAAYSQTTFQEQAARLQNINAYLLDFRPATAPERVDRNRLAIVFDVYPQPSLDTRVGNKKEPLDPPSIVPKLRLRYVLARGFMIGAAYAPGLEFDDYEAEFISLEAGYRGEWARWRWGIRASYTDGDVTGPITELAAQDFFQFENSGVDLSLGRLFGRFHVYLFAGGNDIETSLNVEEGDTLLANTDETIYGGGGATFRWGDWAATVEQNITDDYLKHVIVSLSYRF